MKKAAAFLIALLMMLNSCQIQEESAKTLQINEAKIEAIFEMLTPIADDLCRAWEIVEGGETDMTVEALSENLNLSADELTEGVIYVYTALSGAAQETVAEAQRAYLKKQVNTCLALHSSELVWIVSCSYKNSGAFEPIEECLIEAEASVNDMTRKSDKLSQKIKDCRELFRLCSQPSDNYETSISRIKVLLEL